MTRSYNVDSMIDANADNLFGNTVPYWDVFPFGIARAYRDYMTDTILPQINKPPQYLTTL